MHLCACEFQQVRPVNALDVRQQPRLPEGLNAPRARGLQVLLEEHAPAAETLAEVQEHGSISVLYEYLVPAYFVNSTVEGQGGHEITLS